MGPSGSRRGEERGSNGTADLALVAGARFDGASAVSAAEAAAWACGGRRPGAGFPHAAREVIDVLSREPHFIYVYAQLKSAHGGYVAQ